MVQVTLVTLIENFNSNLWKYHFKVPSDLADQFKEENRRRIVYTVKGKAPVHACLMSYDGHWMVLTSQKALKNLGLAEGDEFEVTIEKDSSEYGMDYPVEMAEVFSQEELAKELFDALTPGKRRSLIYLINAVKNTQSRLNKALAIADHLMEANGQLDFKEVNRKIKEYNALSKLNKH